MLGELDNATIYLEYQDKLSREELEELFALKAVRARPDLLSNVMVFEKLCFALSGEIPSFEMVEHPNLLMVVSAIHKLQHEGLLPDMSANVFETIRKYIACVAHEEGWVILPKILSFAQTELNELSSDYALELFAEYGHDRLMEMEPFDDEDPISNHCAKLQACKLFLASINKS